MCRDAGGLEHRGGDLEPDPDDPDDPHDRKDPLMTAPATVTLVGRLGRDPELRYTASGKAVASLSLATSERRKDPTTGEWSDGPASWWRVTAWGPLAEAVVEATRKGDALVIVGRISERTYEHNGEERRAVEVTADVVAADLRWAKAAARSTGGGSATQLQDDPWRTDAPASPAAGQPGEGMPW